MLENKLKQSLHQEQIEHLYADCRPYVYSVIVITGLISYLDSSEIGRYGGISIWTNLVLLVAVARSIDAFLFYKSDKETESLFFRFSIGTVLAAISWGLFFWNNFSNETLAYQSIILLIAIVLTSSASITLSYHLGLLLTFQAIVLFPLFIRVLLESSAFFTILTFLIPTLFIIQGVIARHIHASFFEKIRLIEDFKEKEKQYKNLQYAVNQHGIISTTNEKGNILYANKRFREISQFSKEELVGENFRLLRSDEHSPNLWNKMYQTIGSGKVWHAEIKNKAKDGSYYWVNTTIVPVIKNKGKPLQYFSISTDITKLKNFELQTTRDKNDALIRARVSQILQGQSDLKQRALESIEAISNAAGLDVQKKLGIFLLPEGACELEMFATFGEYTKEFLHKEQCVKLGDCLCGRAAVSGKLIISDDCFTDPDHTHSFEGMKRHGHYIVPLTHDGKILGILFIYTDPNPPKDLVRIDTLNYIGNLFGLAIANERVKEELEQAKKNAEEMAQAKSNFLANMSHEIRTPMNGVLGMLELLNDRNIDEQSKEYVDIAHSSANMLLNVINDILDISKIESGKLHIESIDFNLRKVVEDSADLLSKLAHQKNLELSSYIPPEMITHLRGDMMRLQQVISNLLSNAIKFTSEGEVIIEIKTIETLDDQIKLRFEIIDTGIGIPEDKQDFLFKAFSQADSSTSREYGGTGLGLTISKNLVEMMGGELGFISKVNEGSTFWFELPFSIVSNKNETSLSLENIRILTIDDNPTNCMILKKYIENCDGTNITETVPEIGLFRLEEAIEEDNPFDILLLDMQMPGVTGDEVAANIRSQSNLNSLKIILLSSMGISKEINEHQHFDLLLNKPIKQSLLLNAISTVQQSADRSEYNMQKKNKTEQLLGRILFVDDNIVNQHVGKAMLSSIGLEYKQVSNGLEAFECIKDESFDLVLMDCQMPVMDGYVATKKIREYEQELGNKKITIVALTANAMQGDREKCLEAGMDDYLSKPYNTKDLANKLSEWLIYVSDDELVEYHQSEQGTKKTELSQTEQIELIDKVKFEETIDLMGENAGLIVDAFIDSGHTYIAEMDKYLAESEFDKLRKSIHTLKGSCGALGVNRLFEHCKVAEEQCRSNEISDMDVQISDLKDVFKESLKIIQSLTDEVRKENV